MRKVGLVFILVVATLVALPAPAADGSLNVDLGWRSYTDLDPADGQPSIGLTFDFGGDDAELRTVFGIYSSSGDGVSGIDLANVSPLSRRYDNLDIDTYEVSFGGIYRTDEGVFNWFAGGGLSMLWVDGTVDGTDVLRTLRRGIEIDDRSAGLYLNGGVFWKLGKNFKAGVNARALILSEIEFRLGQNTLDVVELATDYYSLSVFTGWEW